MSDLTFYTHGQRQRAEAALTFDDGPNPHFTPALLDLLDNYKVKAAFFLIGMWAERSPDLVQEIYYRGHLIGNHGYSHSKERGDFIKCDHVLSNILGEDISYVRPPYLMKGLCKNESKWLYNKKIILGQLDARDYRGISSEEIKQNMVSNIQAGSISILHDGSEIDHENFTRPRKMIEALVSVIPKLQKSVSFVRVDHMVLEP